MQVYIELFGDTIYTCAGHRRNAHAADSQRRLEARADMAPRFALVCARRRRAADAGGDRPDQLALPRRHARIRRGSVAGLRISAGGGGAALDPEPGPRLAAVPASELVFPALAPRLSRRVRG